MPGRHNRTDTHRQTVCHRPSIGVYFTCANRYVRVLRNHAGTYYLARCPNCARTIRFRIAPTGTPQRTFTVSC